MNSNTLVKQSALRRGVGSLPALAIASFWMLPFTVDACVGCRQQTVETSTKTLMAGAAFSWSVLFMLAFVFSIVGALTWFFVVTCRRIDAERNAREL